MDAPASTQTHVQPHAAPHDATSIDIGLVCKTLRKTLSTIQSLTRRYGFCFAALSRVAEFAGHSVSTIRKHLRRLIALGIVRREAVAGYADRLFICPMSAWKSVAIGVQNGETHSIENPAPLEMKNNKQTRTASKPRPEPAPVVVLSATPSEETAQDEEADLSAFRAFLEAEEGEAEDADAALGDVETLVASSDTAPVSLAPVNAPSASPVPEPAPVLASPVNSPARADTTPPGSAPTVKASPKPSPSPLTPEARRTLEQIVAAGVSHTTAVQAVQDDPARADAALRAFLAYQQRKPVDSPTALYRVAFREGWKPRERQENCNGFNSRPVTAAALGLVASPPRGNGATVTVQDAAALRAMIASTRRAVNPLRC